MYKFIVFAVLVILFSGCSNNPANQSDDKKSPDSHEHDDVKIQITAYSNEFELFAEADPFVAGKPSDVLCHFSNLPDFTALTEGAVKIQININGKEVTQSLEKPTRKGIYSFNITPETSGKGSINFHIVTAKGVFQVSVPDVEVFADEHDAIHDAEEKVVGSGNAVFFSKEQSWKVEFATDSVKTELLGQVIKTTAQVQPAPDDEVLVTAKTNGMAFISGNSIREGKELVKNQKLFTITGKDLANNNTSVRFSEARNNYEKTKADFERLQKLVQDKIVSESEYLEAKNRYENSKVIYEKLAENFNESGQVVLSPITGFVKECFVINGQYVEPGQKLISIIKNKSVQLYAEIPTRYFPYLNSVRSVNIKSLPDNRIISLESIDPAIFSFGKSTTSGSFLIPVTLQLNSSYQLIPGSFDEMYLKTEQGNGTLVIPNSAILEDQGVYFVYAQVTPELFEKKIVTIGTSDGTKTEIINGLAEGDRIVTKGAILIKLTQVTGGLDAHSGHVH